MSGTQDSRCPRQRRGKFRAWKAFTRNRARPRTLRERRTRDPTATARSTSGSACASARTCSAKRKYASATGLRKRGAARLIGRGVLERGRQARHFDACEACGPHRLGERVVNSRVDSFETMTSLRQTRMNTAIGYALVFVGGGLGAAARHWVNRTALASSVPTTRPEHWSSTWSGRWRWACSPLVCVSRRDDDTGRSGSFSRLACLAGSPRFRPSRSTRRCCGNGTTGRPPRSTSARRCCCRCLG